MARTYQAVTEDTMERAGIRLAAPAPLRILVA
jgi:hypothetical protein